MENNIFNFNPDNWESMLNLMEHEADYPVPVLGEDENGDSVLFEICADRIVTRTRQKNSWLRTNVYHKDGTVEELYEK